MKAFKVIATIIGALLKYAPVIIVIAEALQMVKNSIDKIDSAKDEKNTAAPVAAGSPALVTSETETI